MFIVLINYIKSLDEIDAHLLEHRAFLEQGYQKNYFIASGPQNPRTGGVLISQMKSRDALEKIIKDDPFFVNGLADYQVIEFMPVKYHKDFKSFIT